MGPRDDDGLLRDGAPSAPRFAARSRTPAASRTSASRASASASAFLAARARGGVRQNARRFNALHALGFGFIEVGTLTGHAQDGNPQPRLFRLPGDQALINRLGFNNRGWPPRPPRSPRRRRSGPSSGSTSASRSACRTIRLSRTTSPALTASRRSRPTSRSTSPPNTKGLRDLQHRDALAGLLGISRATARATENGRAPVPMLVKLAPDLSEEQHADAVELVEELGIDGIIATNTTIARDPLSAPAAEVEAIGNGGLSGRPRRSARALRAPNLRALRRARADHRRGGV